MIEFNQILWSTSTAAFQQQIRPQNKRMPRVFHADCSIGNHGEAHVLILIGDVLVLRNGARG